MYRLFLLFLTISFICCNSGSGKKAPGYEYLLEDNIGNLFLEGKRSVTLITNKPLTKEQKKILQKLNSKIKGNIASFDNYVSSSEADESFIKRKLGFTDKEFDLLLSIFIKKETVEYKGTVQVIKNGDLIKFSGTKDFTFLDSLTINSKDSSAVYKHEQLIKKTVDSTLSFSKYLPQNEKLENIVRLASIDGIMSLMQMGNKYELIFGRLRKSNKPYLFFAKSEPNNTKNDYPTKEFYSIIID